MSYKCAATRFAVPSSTIYRHETQSIVIDGGKNLISEEEQSIVTQIIVYSHKRIPMTLDHLKDPIFIVLCIRSDVRRFALKDEILLPSLRYGCLF